MGAVTRSAMLCVINQAMVELLEIFMGQDLLGLIKRAKFRGSSDGRTGKSSLCG